MMNQNLKDLFYSNNEEDIKLALIIARKENVNPRDVNDIFDSIDFTEFYERHGYEAMQLFGEYLEEIRPGYVKDHLWDYNEWKQEKEI